MITTRKSVFMSVVSLVLCLSMLLGSTYAWFTDQAVSGDNIIQSGTLDIDLHWAEDLNGTWHETENVANDPIFNYDNWEPGFTQVRYLKVINAGNLAFKYALRISPNGEVGDLAEVMDVYFVKNPAANIDTRADIENMLPVGTLAELIADPSDVRGVLLPAGMNEPGYYSGETILGVVIKMRETAGNEYQDSSVGDSFNVELHATQYTYEEDIFGNDYDTEAPLPDFSFSGSINDGGSADITVSGGQVAEDVTVSGASVSAQVPAGVKVTDGANKLSLSVKDMDASESNVQLQDGEAMKSVNVHMDGVAADNTVPMKVIMPEAAAKGLNKGNLQLYHVENGATVAMTQVDTLAQLTAHNQFYYDPATGDVTLSLATFSEIALVADTVNAWNGDITEAFSGGTGAMDAPYIIANADQLAYFNKLISTADAAYTTAHYRLASDLNFGGEENANKGNVWYPIGYWAEQEGTNAAGEETWYDYGGPFKGFFDGAGHTVTGIYQNTWIMDGNYDHGYWDAAMGLFGYVHHGTVKNLTVDHFSSDGEFTPTGCVAAYACGATFENIAITNCNPRVYNTGNGGIIGIAGNTSAGHEDHHLYLTNITVDNSNKISALWGSWDVACGGLIGMYRSALSEGAHVSEVHFTNCHVSAQIDVNNDVCANYQYYAYRYAGMIIGSVRDNVTKDGKTLPNMTGIYAEDCTVHFGDWNDYYYCELVANTLASYTHDHQFSRLTQVASVDTTNKTVTDLKGNTTAIPTSGRQNYVVVTGDHATENAECFHFVNGIQHFHDVADTDNPNPTETVNGETVLKENNQHIYLEFKQLFTGYSWGVNSIGVNEYHGFEVLDITLGDQEESVEKFAGISNAPVAIQTGTAITLGKLFAYNDKCGVEIKPEAITITVDNKDEANPVSVVLDKEGKTDWQEYTLTFTGTGDIDLTIQDYYFCKPATISAEILNAEEMPEVDRFALVFPNTESYLYRIGNMNAVSISKLFKLADGVKEEDVGTVSVEVKDSNGNVLNVYTASTGAWDSGSIDFANSFTGVVKVTISDDNRSTPLPLTLEVVKAHNVTGLSNTLTSNVVLLNDCELNSLTVSGRNTVYGNGFTATYTGDGRYLNNGLKLGVINVKENGTLDNLRVVASIYPTSYMFYTDEAKKGPYEKDESDPNNIKYRYYYQLSAVAASDNATISNCYIYGARNNIFINTGNVTVKDTILECGTLANVQIQSNSSHTVTFENVTTIQHQVKSNVVDTSKTMMGAGIIVGPETTENPKIMLKGNFKQYNWVNEDDQAAVSNITAQKIIEAALAEDDFIHTVNGKPAANLGIIFLNEYDVAVENKTGLPYEKQNISVVITVQLNGQAYSLKNAGNDQIFGDTAKADRETSNPYYKPQFSYSADLGGQEVPEGGDEHCFREGDTIKVMFPSGDTKELNLAGFVDITKYTGQNLNLVITCKDENGNAVTVNGGKVTLSNAGEYTITYTVTDTTFFNKDGETVTDSASYSWNVTLSVSLKDTAVPDARFAFDATKQKMGYYKPTLGDVKQYLPFLAGLKIYDYNGQEEYLRFNGDSDFNKIASITITGYSSNKASVEIKLTDGGVIHTQFLARANSGGGSTYTGKIKTSNNTVYFVTDSGTSNKDTTTTAAYWYVDYYSFIGNNGVPIQSGQQTFNSTGSSASTPSGSFNTTIKYTVNYDANGGNCGQNVGYATSASAAVTLPTPTRSGHIFAGWYTAASGGTRVGGAGDSYTPSANTTLYAQWKAPSTVTYNANGGSCSIGSAKYDGTALTLPNASRDGYWFGGWYTENGEKVGDAGAAFEPDGDITLYAHWQEKVEFSVTFDANGGSVNPSSVTYQGTPLSLPEPTKENYRFNGWYTAASGGSRVGGAGDNYTPSGKITLYAQWSQYYTITVSTTNANVSGVSNGQKACQGDTFKVTVSFTQSNNKKFTVTAGGNTLLSKTAAGTYEFEMPANDVAISASSEKSCVTGDTLVMLADGTEKRIDQVTYTDQLLAWDFFNGKYAAVPASVIFYHGDDMYRVLQLNFEDGTSVKVLNNHGFYSVSENKFVSIDEENVDSYLNKYFVKVDGDSRECVRLVSYETYEEYTGCYSIQTAVHNNFMVEGMFSLTLPPYEGWFSYFEIGGGMKYDTVKMQADIEKYGLYTYEELADYVTYEQFMAFNGPYLKVLVGRGVLTFEQILELIEEYLGG